MYLHVQIGYIVLLILLISYHIISYHITSYTP